ncbi:MAG: PSD1 and planctomycete cytochrome C domain-containing protein [Limisphaerales bacterium]
MAPDPSSKPKSSQATGNPGRAAWILPELVPGWLPVMLGLLAATGTPATGAPQAGSPDFNLEIRPILEGRCFECHGAQKQKADLRFDRRREAIKGGESGPAWKAGHSDESLLIQWVEGRDSDRVMPPKGERLTERQVSLLRAWIDSGADWPKDDAEDAADEEVHWSFRPVRRPPVPKTDSGDVSPIDAFIGDRLAKNGLTPAPEASRVTLIRRLYLVMLGLPPTPEEVKLFVEDPDPKAFEKWVDRVLDDPRYGERWGRHWLDVIRFAETNGFETNRERPNAWRFRDYVIDAFNRDVPFNRFIREQIAGDALGADVATGFLVGGPVDIVGSPDPVLTAQQRADELDDMVNTTGTAFLGLTLGCARCHTHKFDPIEQREYYAMTALLGGVRHGERALALPAEAAEEVARLSAKIADLEERLTRFIPKAKTEERASGAKVLRPPVNALSNEEALDPVEARFVRFTILASTGGEPCLDELEVYSGDQNVALASAGTRATASGTLAGFEIHQLAHLNDGQTGNSRSWISNESGRGWVQLEFPEPRRIGKIVWGRDRKGEYGDRLATEYRIEVAVEPGDWKLVASSKDREPWVGGEKKPAEPPYRFEGLPDDEARQGKAWLAEWESAKARREALSKPPMVYAGTFTQPGETHRLHRGDPMQKRETVLPATLSMIRRVELAAGASDQDRRLALANWLADDANPLTPRVIVNRIWQHHFGVGWVDTPNDVGKNGSLPTHPELLDWMAAELRERGWSLMAIPRRLLLSATWRQSSAPRPEPERVDAGNRLLWRFPPRRLEAEAVRDGILHLSGALDPTRGGPSFHLLEVDRENVYHYHPKDDFGPAEYRRMVYSYKVRMEQDDVFGAFDCPDGSLVVPRRSVSTTALQALNLFNSRFVVRQAEILSKRLEREAGPGIEDQVRLVWRLAFNRDPGTVEVREATDFAGTHGVQELARAVFNANEFLFIP